MEQEEKTDEKDKGKGKQKATEETTEGMKLPDDGELRQGMCKSASVGGVKSLRKAEFCVGGV